MDNILLTTIKFKTFQDHFVKFKDFKALNLVQSNSRLFKTFKALYRPYYYCYSYWEVTQTLYLVLAAVHAAATDELVQSARHGGLVVLLE